MSKEVFPNLYPSNKTRKYAKQINLIHGNLEARKGFCSQNSSYCCNKTRIHFHRSQMIHLPLKPNLIPRQKSLSLVIFPVIPPVKQS